MKVLHDFEEQRFSNLTKCFVCDEIIKNEVITGVVQHTPDLIKRRLPLEELVPKGRGSTCKVCGVNVHTECASKIRTPCARVSHQFELRSYPPFSKMCHACGTGLHGLYNQGYRCKFCGIDVHPGCRTNVNIKQCEAAPDHQGHEEEQEEQQEEDDDEKFYQYVGQESTNEQQQEEQGEKRKSLGQKLSQVVFRRRTSKAKSKKIQIPSSLPDMGRELRKLHTQNRAVAMQEAERWEKEELPKLMTSKKDLTKLKMRLRNARDKVARKVDKKARTRTNYYRTFVKKQLSKDKKRKKREIEQIVEKLLDTYSKYQCRENEMLEELLTMVDDGNNKELIRSEIANGPCQPNGKLERYLTRLERLHEQVKIATESLESVRREIFFPRWKHWFARIGFEGTYVALGTLWVEMFQASMALRVVMLPKKKGDLVLVPTVILALGGYDTKVNFDEMGVNPNHAKQRQKGSSNGVKLVTRIEQLSVSGSALPVSFTLDQVSLDLEFFLNIEMEYIESRKRNVKGSWRLKPNTFSLQFKRFELNFKGGSLNIPDALLRTVVKNLIATLSKGAVKSALPPEFGEYIKYVHQHTPDSVRSTNSDQFRYHGRMDVSAQVDLETLDYEMKSSATNTESHAKKSAGFAKRAFKGAARLALAAAGATASSGPKYHAFKDIPVESRIQTAIGLDTRQIDLFVRTQQEMGLTWDALFPDDSLKELGFKAIYISNVKDLQNTVEAANRIGMKLVNGELISDKAPLVNLLNIVQYVLTYFGPTAPKNAFTERIIAIWQGALDKTMKKMATSDSFKNKFNDFGISSNSLLTRKSSGSNKSMMDDNSSNGDLQQQSSSSKRRVKRIVFQEFIEKVIQLSRKRVITQMEVVTGEITVGLERFITVGRDRMLQAAAKSKGGNAMVFQLRNTKQTSSAGIDDIGDIVDDDSADQFEMEESFNHTMSGQSSSGAGAGADDNDDDDIEDDDLLIINVNENENDDNNTPYGERQRLKEQMIHRKYDKHIQRLAYIRNVLIKDLKLEIDSSAGDGKFNTRFMDIDLVSPVDFRLNLASTLFANRSRVNDWPWRRVAKAQGNDSMHIAIIKILKRATAGPGTEVYSNPDDPQSLHLEFSGIESYVRSAANKPSALNITMRPMGSNKTTNHQSSSWTEPGRLQFEWTGADDLEFVGKMDFLQIHGDLAYTREYASDMLNWSMRAFTDKRIEQISQFLLATVIRYARSNTFTGTLCPNIHCASTQEDLYIRISDPTQRNKRGATLQLEHNLDDFTDDIAHILSQYVTDPVNLGKK